MSSPTAILLDTTVVIDVLRSRNQRRSWLVAQVQGRSFLAISAITLAEIHAGIRPGEERATSQLLHALDLFPVTAQIAERAGNLKAALRRTGQTRSIADMIVAATGLEHHLSVATDNRKDFQIAGLDLFPLP